MNAADKRIPPSSLYLGSPGAAGLPYSCCPKQLQIPFPGAFKGGFDKYIKLYSQPGL